MHAHPGVLSREDTCMYSPSPSAATPLVLLHAVHALEGAMCTHIILHAYTPLKVLMTVGTLAGRHRYFAQMSAKIFKRFLPGRVKPKLKCPQQQKPTSKTKE